MAETSYGILIYRRREGRLEVLLIHPGGPFWKNKDDGAWSIPKGGANAGEEPLQCARREFEEELGCCPPQSLIDLSPIRQKGGKVVHAWACEGDFDPAKLKSNLFEMEWPPKSGKRAEFPEVDRCAWFDLPTARVKINSAQAAFLADLERQLDAMK